MSNAEDHEDLGLTTLLEVRDELGLEISDSLVKRIHRIQRKYQFEHDRTLSHQATERLIDETLDQND